MTLGNHQPTFRVIFFLVLGLAVTLGAARPSWGGPYLRVSDMNSSASSYKQCGNQVLTVFRKLKREGRVSLDRRYPRYASTKKSTIRIDCVFVGRSEQRRNQWIFYIAIASNDRQESAKLFKLVQRKIRGIQSID